MGIPVDFKNSSTALREMRVYKQGESVSPTAMVSSSTEILTTSSAAIEGMPPFEGFSNGEETTSSLANIVCMSAEHMDDRATRTHGLAAYVATGLILIDRCLYWSCEIAE